MADLTDETLVHRTLAGDQDAFAELVRRYRRAALARALAILLDTAEADDVAQESFAHAYEALATCRDPARFESWLLTIVRRRSLNQRRAISRRRTAPMTDSIPAHDDAPEGATERMELRHALLGALAKLTPIQRDVVILSDLEEWPHARIASVTGISITMSRRHLSDARHKLRKLLATMKET